mmetsp:Transcript_78655/g.149505  ORF Transcript_78655/g.149505 Transcript_78655/m.149505 type:complete len:226 (+) Transcript_78655:328-1005(+)
MSGANLMPGNLSTEESFSAVLAEGFDCFSGAPCLIEAGLIEADGCWSGLRAAMVAMLSQSKESNSIATRNSSRSTIALLSLSTNLNNASTCSAHRSGLTPGLCRPSHSNPAMNSALFRPPLEVVSSNRNASTGQSLLVARAQRICESKALVGRSSNSSAFTKTLATGSCCHGFCPRLRQDRTSYHQYKRSCTFVNCSDRSKMFKSRAWKSTALFAKRRSCSATSN